MVASRSSVPAPRSPAVREIASAEELLPAARLIVQRKGQTMLEGLEVRPGTRVLLLTDSTNDPLVVEAFRRAIREAGGLLGSIELNGYPEMTDSVELLDAMFSCRWWPDWVWSAIREADVVLQGAFLKMPHAPNVPLEAGRKPQFVEMAWTRDLLASNYETFPVEVRELIDKKTWQSYANAQRLELADAEGTELRWSPSKEDWEKETARNMGRVGRPYIAGHLMFPVPSTNLEGVLVTSSLTYGGPVPRTACTVKGGQIGAVEGGGAFGEALLDSIEQYKHLHFPGYPGPGVNWVSTMAVCTHPKGRRSVYFDQMAGSGRVHAWGFGHRRSGVVHASIGEGMVREDYKVIRHTDLYFPTLLADGKKVIQDGHLTVLDDPEVRQIATRYGDPDELLAEEWIPAVAGVNSR